MTIKEVKVLASQLFVECLKDGRVDYPCSNITKPIWEYLDVASILNEEWFDIKGHEGSYQISNYSRVKSIAKNNRHYDIILKQSFYRDGYMYVTLSKVKIKMHRMVGLKFIDNPLNKKQINHKNGFKWDNRIVNLEWHTPLENQLHALATGLKVPKKGEFTHDAIRVIQYSIEGVFIKEWGCIKDAGRELGIDSGTISKCCKRNINYKQSYGFIWRYKSEVESYGDKANLPLNEINKISKPKFHKRRQTNLAKKNT